MRTGRKQVVGASSQAFYSFAGFFQHGLRFCGTDEGLYFPYVTISPYLYECSETFLQDHHGVSTVQWYTGPKPTTDVPGYFH